MKNNSGPLLDLPEIIKPIFQQEDGHFTFELAIANPHPYNLHFYVASTLGCCLTQTTGIAKINPGVTVNLNFQIKQTNLVRGGIQTLALFSSKSGVCEWFPFDHCHRKDVKLKFSGDAKMDQAILQILDYELDNCLSAADNYRSKGELAQALNKCEEAYEINRYSLKAVDAMIQFRTLLKDYRGAIRDITSVLLLHQNNPHFLFKKLELVIQWQQNEIGSNQQLFFYVNTNLDFFKCNIILLNIEEQKMLQKMLEEFKKFTKKTEAQTSSNKLHAYLHDKAVQKYSEQKTISKYYGSKEEFEVQFNQIFLSPKEEENSTPDEILDPIHYQIMKQPFILPSGSSYEQKSLKLYFQTNGCKDPISRQPVNINFVYPNHTLEKFIKNHSKLKIWQKYEHDLLNS